MRPIDADALYTELVKMSAYGYLTAKRAIRRVKQSPTIDAVPVIRCKDCKWFGKIGCAVNIVDESDEPKENDYCSWAERKEE